MVLQVPDLYAGDGSETTRLPVTVVWAFCRGREEHAGAESCRRLDVRSVGCAGP